MSRFFAVRVTRTVVTEAVVIVEHPNDALVGRGVTDDAHDKALEAAPLLPVERFTLPGKAEYQVEGVREIQPGETVDVRV